MIYVINKSRLIREYEFNLKHKGQGVLNWFISPDNILNILIDVFGVTYLFREHMLSATEQPDLMMMLDSKMSILGILEDEKEPEPESKSVEDTELESEPVKIEEL